MSIEGRIAARNKMAEAGVSPAAIDVFSAYYDQLETGATGLIREADIEPITEVPALDQGAKADSTALGQTVMIKLNGGLGTSMGMAKAKSLLPVRDGQTFIDLIVAQVLAARAKHQIKLPLIFMNSFNTRDDTLAALATYPELAVGDLPLDFLQSKEPKLRASDMSPVEWPKDPDLEWCPPGHGDIYPSLFGSGLLDQLLAAGFRYASVANSDNLGSAPSAEIAAWFASSGAPYAAEVCKRTPMDRKGGHLARRRSDGRLVLRDTAQTAPEDMDFFTDEHRHPFFHTNNLWFNLAALRDLLVARGGVMGLPLIRNEKTVDPRDPESTQVIQVESAMGAAVEVFEGATALEVPRSRFLPVKTTNELLLVRSDAFELDDAARLVQRATPLPVVSLSGAYKKINDFDARFPAGVPSLRQAKKLEVEGDWTFGAGVKVIGEVQISAEGSPGSIPDNSVLQ